MAHILLVEDDPDVGALLKEALEQLRHTVEWIDNGRRAHQAIFDAQFHYDVLVCDLHLPGMNGKELLIEVRPYLEGKTPVVIISGVAYMIEALGELTKGAFAVVQKPVGVSAFQEIIARALRQRDAFREIKRLREQVQDLQERNQALIRRNEELFVDARIDPLTRLGNRRRLDEELRTLSANAERYSAPFAVALCDVDGFGVYNKRYGVEVGDSVLRLLGRSIREACRQGDAIYRFRKEDDDLLFRVGGDEFLLILAGQGLDGAYVAMERLRTFLASAQAEDGWQHALEEPVTISVGLAANAVDGQESVEDLLLCANEFLRKAKDEGGDCVRPELS